METVTISLNGREVAGPPGATILDLATQVGVEIPTLCHHPLLKSAGACRVCLVEDQRSGKLLASCVTPITDGMEIVTHSPSAVEARRGVLELILSDHPSACVVCSKGNECVLRSLAKDHGICDPDIEPIRRWRPVEEVNPFIVRDLTKCVLCGRCVRVCKDYEAVGAVEYTDRGYTSHPGTADRTPLEGSECNFCGSCVAICPTDALAERDRLTFSSGKALAPGICSYCGTGCHLEYEMVDGLVAGARGVIGSPVNSLSLCVRGHYGQDALASPDRLTDPLVRNGDGNFLTSSWDDALGEVALRLNEIRDRYGPSSIGVIVGTQCSNEELYLASRFSRSILRTPHVDSASSLSSGVVAEGLVSSLKEIGPGAPIGRILEADTIVMINARPDYTHPVIARNVRQAVRNNGASLVQIDPLTTRLDPFTHLHFKEEIGSQPRLLIQLIKELVAGNLHDEEFVLQHATNAEDFLARIKRQPTEQGSSEEIAWAAALVGGGRTTVFLLGPLVARATQGYIITRLVADLAILCGQPHHIRFLFEGCNEMGAWEMGCTSARRLGCLAATDPGSREPLQDAWGPDAIFDRGLDTLSMLHSAESGTLKALLLLGVDPLAVFPDPQRTRKALAGMDLVVRTGMFPAVIEECADVVFPATAPAETDGTYINLEGRIQGMSKVTDPPGDARPNARLLLDLSGRLGAPMGFVTARDVFDEIRAVCPEWSDLTWAEVKRAGGVALHNHRRSGSPGEEGEEACRLVMYTPPDSFSERPAAPPDRPWKVFLEEQAAHPGDGVASGRSYRLSRFEEGKSVRMNQEDAERISATSGSWVVLRSATGEVKARLVVDPDVPGSSVVVPAGGPGYLLQRLLSWPEEYCPLGWDRLFVSATVTEE